MKKLSISLIALLITVAALSQPRGYQRVYYNYKGEPGVTSIKVPGILLRLAANIGDLDPDERRLVRSLKSVSVLSIDEMHRYPGVNFVDEMKAQKMRGEYQLLMEVHDGNEDVIIAARKHHGKVRDLIVVVGGEENTLVHVRGRIDSDLLECLADVSGIDELKITAEI